MSKGTVNQHGLGNDWRHHKQMNDHRKFLPVDRIANDVIRARSTSSNSQVLIRT